MSTKVELFRKRSHDDVLTNVWNANIKFAVKCYPSIRVTLFFCSVEIMCLERMAQDSLQN